ncbi:MAG: AAA family ATPase [Phycisphaera sp.]|nr:AAA family ATPase [Phycisphaera sp.]
MTESGSIETEDRDTDLLAEISATRDSANSFAVETVGAADAHRAAFEERLSAETTRNITEIAAIDERRDSGIARAEAAQRTERDLASSTARETCTSLERSAEEMRVRIRRKFVNNKDAAEKALEEATWLAETVYEANETRPRDELEKLRTEIGNGMADLEELDARMVRETRRYRQPRPRPIELDHRERSEAELAPLQVLRRAQADAATAAEGFRRLRLPRLFRGPIFVLPAMLFAGLGIGIASMVAGTGTEALVTGGGIGLGVFILIGIAFYVIARREVVAAWRPFDLAVQKATVASTVAEEVARADRVEQEKSLVATRDHDLAEARARFGPIGELAKSKAQARLAEIERRLPLNIADAERIRDEAMATADRRFEKDAKTSETAHREETAQEESRHAGELASIERDAAEDWAGIESRWRSGIAAAVGSLTEHATAMRNQFPPFTDPSWRSWTPSASPPAAIRVGNLTFDRNAVEGGAPSDPRLAVEHPDLLDLPAVISLPSRASLVLDVDPDHRETGLDVLRGIMLRILASVPPGKARFSIFDPVGLGQNFAGFMHLEDELPGMVGDRIWTEPRQIEQRLVDVTEHMETVIQKYLRNEFPTIDAYNEAAGEIAEPYRFLVIADFPANFTEESARRLASILQSGPRCGVFTIVLRDRRVDVPEKFDVDDLERHAVMIRSRAGRLVFDAENLGDLPFHPDPGPDDELLISLAHSIGRAAREAGRVEVPFETIAPAEEDFWTRSTTRDLHVALGRAGATRLQELVLGVGTAQHALVAGKTGSGKSTLLHALVTNLACWHSPDEIEFHLVDFKKGVEFKTYATHRLPHARSVAVESDREFGLSVLQGLDEELSDRGERFRAEGVQDLAGWRSRRPDEPMPRTLLVIDEFQELFVDDDKVSQDASLLLDRLVRQGRAFGMHVLLGSQTLGGAYSLNRSTMGQMGVRIALACNEQDSMLILSDDNAAARLLSRPGEAIYNDQGGLVEGNSPFQIVWLPDEIRERYLARVSDLAKERGIEPRPCVVFEGNAPAVLADNRPLRAMIETPPADRPASIPIWLGDAVAIKDPTSATLRRQAGSNLVIVGQQDEPALAISTAALLATAASHAPGNLQCVVLDGTTADDPNAGFLDSVAGHLPHRIDRPDFRGTAETVLELGTELARRIDTGDTTAGTILLLVHGLQRFRVLRRSEDDFGFTSDDTPPTPDRVFGEILREGPEHGIHVVAWADTVGTLERCVDRQTMRAFDQRAMFQVGATDSSTLIDSPAASQLGANRGLLYSDERGTIEKFRPWALPSEAYLMAAGRAMDGRSRD